MLINTWCLLFLQCFEEVLGIGFPGVLDAEVVHNQGEGDRAMYVAPQPGGVSAFEVAVFGEAFAQEIVGDLAGLRESVHALTDLDVHIPLVYER